MLKTARYAHAVTGKKNVCLAGGVALNCVANGKILRSNIFDDIWIQPAAGDAGGALGAALYAWHQILQHPRDVNTSLDSMQAAALGPSFSREQIKQFLDDNKLPHEEFPADRRDQFVAEAINNQQVVGMFQGRMEFGPRALGNRSILADARSPEMQSYLNRATKFRESFRPFAPMVSLEDVGKYFETIRSSPYMLLVDQLRGENRKEVSVDRNTTSLKDWVNQERSDIPAVTHVDYSARVQTVDKTRSPRMHAILTEFKTISGCSVIVNTSFNVRSEPIVCTPEDAYVCFMRTGMDVLVLENFVLHKKDQPPWPADDAWQSDFLMD